MYLLPVMAQLDLKHRTVIPEGVDVDIEILILIYKIVALLLQRAERGIGQLQQLRVFVLGQALLVFDDLASGAALLGLIIRYNARPVRGGGYRWCRRPSRRG